MKFNMLWLKKLARAVAIFFLILLAIYSVGRPYQKYTDSQIEGDRAPYLQKQSATAMSILWHTSQPEIGVVRYGRSPDNLDMEMREAEVDEAHELRLSQLRPASRYYYAVGSPDGMVYGGEENWFTTAPETGTANEIVRLWVIGDSGQPGKTQQSVREAMKKWIKENPREEKPYLDQWLALGDNAYRSGTNKQYQAALFDVYPGILKNITLWPVYGNHDARRWAFFNIFSLPEQGESGGVASGTEHYYSFDYANIHYVVLDSHDSDRQAGGDMLNWLEQDLKANQQDWLIVAFHHPPYSKGSHDSDNGRDSRGRLVEMRQYVLPLLEKYGADLVLSGHSHGYERSRLMDCHYGDSSQYSEKNIVSEGVEGRASDYIKGKGEHSGTVYVVAGASAKVDIAPMNHPAMAVSMREAGSLLIDIEGNRLVSRYINARAEVVDKFTIEKRRDDSWTKYKNENYTGCQL